MKDARFNDPTRDEHFYARALAIMVGPSRRMALLIRVCNLAYWLAMLSALAWLSSQVLDRQPPLVIHETTLLTPTVMAGQPIRVAYELTRKRTCETDISWSIYDGLQEIHRFGPQHVAAPGLPGQDVFTRAWATPANAAPGHGKLRVVLAFACPGNFLQTLYPVALVLPDIPIEISSAR